MWIKQVYKTKIEYKNSNLRHFILRISITPDAETIITIHTKLSLFSTFTSASIELCSMMLQKLSIVLGKNFFKAGADEYRIKSCEWEKIVAAIDILSHYGNIEEQTQNEIINFLLEARSENKKTQNEPRISENRLSDNNSEDRTRSFQKRPSGLSLDSRSSSSPFLFPPLYPDYTQPPIDEELERALALSMEDQPPYKPGKEEVTIKSGKEEIKPMQEEKQLSSTLHLWQRPALPNRDQASRDLEQALQNSLQDSNAPQQPEKNLKIG